MFGSAWRVSAAIVFTSNGVGEMGRLAGASTRLNASLARQQGLISKNELAMIRYRERMKEIEAAQSRFGTRVAAGIGVLGLFVMGKAVSDAARLQTLMIGIGNATGASANQLDRMRQAAFELGNTIGVTATDAAGMMAVIARSSGGVFMRKDGTFDEGGFMAIAPQIAKLAKIQNITRGVGLDDATQTGMQLAHLFRQYSGAGFAQIADYLTRLSEMMPDSLNVARNQFTYFLPQFKAMGITDQQSIATMALLDRMGYGRGKGGTNISDLLAASLGGLQMTKHAQVGKDMLLRKMGLVDSQGNSVDFTDKGANLIDFLRRLNEFAKSHGRIETLKDFRSAFGIQGARIAQLALDPEFVNQLGKIQQFMKNPAISLNEQMKNYTNENTQFQFGRAVANLTSVLTELGYPWLNDLTQFFRAVGDNLHGFQKWLHSHRDEEKQIGGAFALLTGASLLRASIGVVAALGSVRAALNALTATAAGDAAIIDGAAIGGGVGGIRGLLGRGLAIGGNILRFADNLLFAGFGEKAGRLVWRILVFAFKTVPLGSLDIIGRGLQGLIFGRMRKYLGTVPADFEAGLRADMKTGFDNAIKIITAPLRALGEALSKLGAPFMKFPGMAAAVERLGVSVGSFLARMAMYVPILDTIGLVLGTQSPAAGEMDPTQSRTTAFYLAYAKRYGLDSVPRSMQSAIQGAALQQHIELHFHGPVDAKGAQEAVDTIKRNAGSIRKHLANQSVSRGGVQPLSHLTPGHAY